ncbi:Hypothetical_protein [Hexamita inflata]|uniref:Hypothetical_protein n=1 Tax=Hexamita inflata TaxID=28002 RepID=A0AA86RCF7_9EUKA|nr:Hypothetical protein HINF_LOCUS62645 [Hexamita inflata]
MFKLDNNMECCWLAIFFELKGLIYISTWQPDLSIALPLTSCVQAFHLMFVNGKYLNYTGKQLNDMLFAGTQYYHTRGPKTTRQPHRWSSTHCTIFTLREFTPVALMQFVKSQ